MKKAIVLFYSFGLLLMACQSNTSTPASPAKETKESVKPSPPKEPKGQDPRSTEFNFEAALANYHQGNHADLVDYLNVGITEVLKESKTLPGPDKTAVTQSLDALKVLAVKVRRTDFKHPDVLENAVARMEMNQAHNYLFISKRDAIGQPDKALIHLKKSIHKMENATVKFKGALKSEADQLLKEHKAVLKQGEEKSSTWEKELSKQVIKMGEWLKNNDKDLRIVI